MIFTACVYVCVYDIHIHIHTVIFLEKKIEYTLIFTVHLDFFIILQTSFLHTSIHTNTFPPSERAKCMYVYMYVCVYTYLCIYIQVYTHNTDLSSLRTCIIYERNDAV